jgi:uncharacterized protein (DUF427 family)
MTKAKEMETFYIPCEDHNMDDFKPPSRFYIINALGDAVYFKTNSRVRAQEEADKQYSKGKYAVRIEIRAGVR